MRLFLVRHASSIGQESDAPLSGEGEAQALELSTALASLGVDQLFSSPYRRALDTMAPFAKTAGLCVGVIDDLRERKLAGGWLPDFLVHMQRSFLDENYCLEGGESLHETARRGLSAIAQIAHETVGKRPAAASHGNLIASVLRTVDPKFGFAEWKAMRNPDIFDMTLAGGVPVAFRRVD
jgi:2,3-bisphosphoglycerate-dependent phosphoglycerate mutase